MELRQRIGRGIDLLTWQTRRLIAPGQAVRVPNLVIERHVRDPDFPFMVSFPRTGSHWLRMLMEYYFHSPTLPLAFKLHRTNAFLCFATHDLDLRVSRSNVLYLYREDPVDTVYSILAYEGQPLDDRLFVMYWSTLYGLHLAKWLLLENASQTKTVVSYENIRDLPESTFSRIAAHFGQRWIPERYEEVAAEVSRHEIRRRARHDRRVVSMGPEYEANRSLFRREMSELVVTSVIAQDARLASYLCGA